MRDPLPTRVFEDVSAYLFPLGPLHVLVNVDRLSGWPVVHQWPHDPSAREVTQAVIKNFVDFGVPVRMRSDNGPQFEAHRLQAKLRQWGVAWGNSTPHYPQSNGHAEAAVAAMKDVLAKILPSGVTSDDFAKGILEFRNTPRENGSSPAEMVFRHSLRSIIPAHRTSYATRWQTVMEAQERWAAIDASVKFRYDENARPLAPLFIGTDVRIRDPKSKLWDRVGVVVGIGRYRSYRVKFANGSVLWRNRRLLRPMVAATRPIEDVIGQEAGSGIGDIWSDDNVPADGSPSSSHPPPGRAINTAPPPLRRGERVHVQSCSMSEADLNIIFSVYSHISLS